MKKNIQALTFLIVMALGLASCKKFLDVVPDNVATLDNAFTARVQAEKYLFTCYSYMPRDGQVAADPAMLAGDELWEEDIAQDAILKNIAMGLQTKVNPFADYWDRYYLALRDCNIFLENVDRVPDLGLAEKKRWIAEVKFLKAYYHFYLMRMYGPIPLIKKNLPVNTDVNQVKVFRDPVDSCFNYITQQLDEAAPDLPETIINPTKELGRITQLIALSLKAKVLVTAASPLFNGNSDQSALKNADGTVLFNAEVSKVKWEKAAEACKAALDMATGLGYSLYKFQPDVGQGSLSDTIKTQLSVRLAVTKPWNSEIIWGNTQSNAGPLQGLITPFIDPNYLDQVSTFGLFSPTLKVAEMFYSQNGVPINEDKTWDYPNRYKLRTATNADKKYIRNADVTVGLNFDREPRFYADMAFDSGIWYGQGRYDDKNDLNLFSLEAKYKEPQGAGKPGYATVTGYYIKKLVHYENVITQTGYTIAPYAWTVIRLPDIYLLYAEALNESVGPTAEVHQYLDLIRARAGLKSVRTSWEQFSNNPGKFSSQAGMREIIHQERLIELAFEGQRFWDLRRWKKAAQYLNAPITGFDVTQTSTDSYYKVKTLFNQTFSTKDYFWPIRDGNVIVNRNLVQNLGW